MNKKELIDTVARKVGFSKKCSEAAVDAVFAAITDALKNKDSVQIMGFGTFEAKHRDIRIGRNPATGEDVEIPARWAPVFKAGKTLKDAVN